MEQLAAFLKGLRERAQLSQVELSKAAGYSETYYGKIESGGRWPSAETLLKILDALDSAPADRHHAARLFVARLLPSRLYRSLGLDDG